MAVVYGPSGTAPTIIYGPGDTTVDTLVAGSTILANCIVFITRYCPYTIVTVTQVNDGDGWGSVILPTNPAIGDVVEVHSDPAVIGGGTVTVGPPMGYNIEGANSIGGWMHLTLRLTSPSNWTAVSLASALY